MKLKKSEIKTATHGYLYEDGHMVLSHKKRDKDAGDIQWVTIYKDIGVKCRFSDGGRLIIDSHVLPFLSVASRVEVKKASVSRGSENTKNRGIAVESISLYNGCTDYGWNISNFPGLISSAIYYQDGTQTNPETFDDVKDKYHWGMENIKAVYEG